MSIRINKARLVAAAIESGMTVRAICATAGVGHQTFGKMTKGQMVQFGAIKRICEILDLKPAEIIEDVDEALQAERPQEPLHQAQGEARQLGDTQEGMGRPTLRRVSG